MNSTSNDEEPHFLKYKEAVLLFWDYDFWREHGERLCYAG